MQPLRNEILFKPLPSKDTTDSGLFVPENCRKISNKGTIVAVGNGTVKNPMRLKIGMIAHRVQNWGEPVIIDNELHFLMDEKAIIAVE